MELDKGRNILEDVEMFLAVSYWKTQSSLKVLCSNNREWIIYVNNVSPVKTLRNVKK
jgi:hypothetical protein